MKIQGGFRNGYAPIDSVKWVNTQGKTITTNLQSEVTKRIRELSKKLQTEMDASIAGGPVGFTRRALFFNFVTKGDVRTNQIIVRGDQAAYLRTVISDVHEIFEKFVPTSNARLTKQGNISGLRANLSSKKFVVIDVKGKKMLVDTTMKGKRRDKRIIGVREEKQRKMVFDFFQQAEDGAKLILSSINGTFQITKRIT